MIAMSQSEAKDLMTEIKSLKKSFDNYVIDDLAWKKQEHERTDPVVSAFANSSWMLNLFVKFVKIVGALAGAVLAVGGVYKLFKHF